MSPNEFFNENHGHQTNVPLGQVPPGVPVSEAAVLQPSLPRSSSVVLPPPDIVSQTGSANTLAKYSDLPSPTLLSPTGTTPASSVLQQESPIPSTKSIHQPTKPVDALQDDYDDEADDGMNENADWKEFLRPALSLIPILGSWIAWKQLPSPSTVQYSTQLSFF